MVEELNNLFNLDLAEDIDFDRVPTGEKGDKKIVSRYKEIVMVVGGSHAGVVAA